MSITYTPQTNFTAKDTMSTSNPDKVLSGVPFDAEFLAISTAFTLAAPSNNPTFSGTASFDVLTATTVNGSTTSTWDTAAATVTAKEAGWDATKTTVDAGAANWDEAYGWGDHALAGYSSGDTTYSAGTNLSLSGTTFNLNNSLTGLTDVTTNAVSIGSWEIKLSGNNLIFAYNGANKAKIDTNGHLTVTNNVTAYGTA